MRLLLDECIDERPARFAGLSGLKNRLRDLLPLVSAVKAALAGIEGGTVVTVKL